MVTNINANHEVSSLQGILNQLPSINENKRLIFRGLDSDNFEILSSIARQERKSFDFANNNTICSHDNWEQDRDFGDEKKLLEAFKSRALPLTPYKPDSLIEWMALAQHYGIPTRLIDWTRNPLVAVYFAVRQMGAGKDNRTGSLVWAIEKPPLLEEKFYDNPYEVKEPCLYTPPNISPNIAAQSSVFTLQKPSSISAGKLFFIRREYEAKIKIELDSLDINRSSLFPDIRGLCEGLRWQYKWFKLD